MPTQIVLYLIFKEQVLTISMRLALLLLSGMKVTFDFTLFALGSVSPQAGCAFYASPRQCQSFFQILFPDVFLLASVEITLNSLSHLPVEAEAHSTEYMGGVKPIYEKI